MSSPPAPRSNANSTKQLLDELDELMQRMLELPVNEPEEDPPAAPALNPPHLANLASPPASPEQPRSSASPQTPRPAASSETPGPRLHAPHNVPAFVPVSRAAPAPQPKERPKQPASKKPKAVAAAPKAAAPAPPKEPPRRKPAATRPVRSTFAPLVPLPANRKPSELPRNSEWLSWPLQWTNRAFDLGTYLLGPAGRWLRGSDGRYYLGWSGIFMFLGALAWGLFKLLG